MLNILKGLARTLVLYLALMLVCTSGCNGCSSIKSGDVDTKPGGRSGEGVFPEHDLLTVINDIRAILITIPTSADVALSSDNKEALAKNFVDLLKVMSNPPSSDVITVVTNILKTLLDKKFEKDAVFVFGEACNANENGFTSLLSNMPFSTLKVLNDVTSKKSIATYNANLDSLVSSALRKKKKEVELSLNSVGQNLDSSLDKIKSGKISIDANLNSNLLNDFKYLLQTIEDGVNTNLQQNAELFAKVINVYVDKNKAGDLAYIVREAYEKNSVGFASLLNEKYHILNAVGALDRLEEALNPKKVAPHLYNKPLHQFVLGYRMLIEDEVKNNS